MPLPPRGRPIAIETELKLAARTGDLPALRRALEAMAASPDASPRATRRRLVSTYYDTPDHALARGGSSLRVRRQGRKFVQTVKSARSPGKSGLSRSEWEDRVKGERPDPLAAQTGRFLSPDIVGHLRPMFRTEVSRLTIPLAPEPATRIEAAILPGVSASKRVTRSASSALMSILARPAGVMLTTPFVTLAMRMKPAPRAGPLS